MKQLIFKQKYLLFIILFIMGFSIVNHYVSVNYLLDLHKNILEVRHNDGINNTNLTIGKTMSNQLNNITAQYIYKNLINRMIFNISISTCILIYLIKKEKNLFFAGSMMFVGTIMSIEIVQFIFAIGFFDIDDVIFGYINFLIAYLLVKVIYAVKNNSKNE